MKKLQEWIHVKFFLVLLQITGLMPLVIGNKGHEDIHKSNSHKVNAVALQNPFQSDLYSALSYDEKRYLDHFGQTSIDLLSAKLRKTPLREHLIFHFEDLPEWRVKRSGGEDPSKGIIHSMHLRPIVEPSSFGLTQTDREYFNIVRTENGVSDFFRFLPRKRNGYHEIKTIKKGEAKHRPKFIYHRVPGSSIPPFSGNNHQHNNTHTKDVAAVSLAKAVNPKRVFKK